MLTYALIFKAIKLPSLLQQKSIQNYNILISKISHDLEDLSIVMLFLFQLYYLEFWEKLHGTSIYNSTFTVKVWNLFFLFNLLKFFNLIKRNIRKTLQIKRQRKLSIFIDDRESNYSLHNIERKKCSTTRLTYHHTIY